ncbi:unnamed protein product [Ambrosiozyma monospora]|uniref:Unnamed protein product n=2 Tax=Ambrosiozyma monospora TaxID=43982 RepID=A0ACB5TWT8_AMBMO|nr:unnamed protein product [Ambrosiozyma monospora]
MALLNDPKGEEIVKERDEVRAKLIQQQHDLLNNVETDSNGSHSSTENDISKDVGNLKLGSPGYKEFEDAHEELPLHQNGVYEDDAADQTLNNEEEDNLQRINSEQENDMVDVSLDMDIETAQNTLRTNPVVGDQLKIALYDTNAINTILNMFFRFPWNNLLHNVVFDIVQQILSASMEFGFNKFLAIDLFDRGQITQLIVDGHNNCLQYEEETNLRLGYMGHLTLIAEEVNKFTPMNTQFKIIEDAASIDAWNQYVNETLVETRNKYNAVLGNDEEVREYLDEGPDGQNSAFQMVYANDGDVDQETADLEDRDVDPSQFSAYMAEQMTGDDKFSGSGSSDEESEEEEHQQQLQHLQQQHQQNGNVSEDGSPGHHQIASSIGGHPYHQMSSGDLDDHHDAFSDEDEYDYVQEDDLLKPISHNNNGNENDDDDDYEDPNDDGQSYVKANHPLYQADGSLNCYVRSKEMYLSDSDSDDEEEEVSVVIGSDGITSLAGGDFENHK